MYVISTIHTYCCFIPVPVLLWSNLSFPSLVLKLCLICAYHAHGRLSKWQLFETLCFSVFTWHWIVTERSPFWFTFFSESNHVDICTLWRYFWFFAVCLFSYRCLVDPLKAKRLWLMIHQLRLLNGLDSHLSHLKTPIVRGLEFLLTHTSTQASLTWHLL